MPFILHSYPHIGGGWTTSWTSARYTVSWWNQSQ